MKLWPGYDKIFFSDIFQIYLCKRKNPGLLLENVY